MVECLTLVLRVLEVPDFNPCKETDCLEEVLVVFLNPFMQMPG
jgi:hypothetical protein